MVEKRKRIGVLASGGGSNMSAILAAIANGEINGDVVLVISDRPQAAALSRAAEAGISTLVVEPKEFSSRDAFSVELADQLRLAQVDLVCLAGFMRIITGKLISAFPNCMMNIHPSLIPSFCGAGYYGHHVHEAVLAYGVKVSGCTVHFVEEEVDGGPIIVQHTVPVLENDTAKTLAARVLIQEHLAYPEAVKLFCAGRLQCHGRIVHVLPE